MRDPSTTVVFGATFAVALVLSATVGIAAVPGPTHGLQVGSVLTGYVSPTNERVTLALLLGGMLHLPVSALSERPQAPPELEPLVRLVNVRPVTATGGFRSPVWCPTAAGLLAFIGHDGTYTFDVVTGRVEKRSTTIAGPFFVWADDDQGLVFRSVDDQGDMRIDHISLLTGDVITLAASADLTLPQRVSRGVAYRDSTRLRKAVAASNVPAASITPEDVFAYQSGDNIYLVTGGRAAAITHSPGQFFLPWLSPDRTKVLFQELSTGLYVYDLRTGVTTALGPGDDASWAPTGDLVVFEVTADNGHNITASNLFVADLTGRRVRLTDTTAIGRPMRPSWSSDGQHLAFDDSAGTLFVADVIRGERR
jgi:hypothetical protein